MLTDPLVTVDWLASHLEDVRVIDGTWSMPNETGDLPNGYIKGAVIFDIDAIADLDSDMAHMLPSAEIFARSVGQMGITLDDTIVIYDRHGVFSAPRVWWTFRMFGHKNVYVLDGGLPAWRDAGHDIAAQPASYAKSFYKVCPARAKVADIDEVLSAASKDIQIIDARPPGRFKGTSAEPRAGLRSGHMPGAINIPFGTLRTPQSRFKPLSDIAQIMMSNDASMSNDERLTMPHHGKNTLHPETEFTHVGRPAVGLATAVSPDITRASTLLFNRAEDLYRSDIRGYGRHGSAGHDALIEAFNLLEGGVGTTLAQSGLAACTLPILANVKAGDHLLRTDSSYGPTRHFCQKYLKGMGVETQMYDPSIGSGIDSLIRENTSVIMLESPGSLTFEIQDIPAITKAAQAKGVTTIIDNTWSGGLSLKPLSLGVDISCHAATKYFGGHSDVMFGATISASAKMAKKIWKRDFTGAACLFGVVLNPCSETDVIAFINALQLFGIGYSYGGFESLAIHCDPQLTRQHSEDLGGPLVRFACGLEAASDLKDDIKQAFSVLP